jgi:hypothetical protein
MEALTKVIKHHRPNLSDSSIKTYTNIVRCMFKDLWPDKDFDHDLYITQQEKVMKHLETIKYNVRKTILSALVSFTEGKVQQNYREQMMNDANHYNALQRENKMTEEQKANWITWKEIEEHLESLKKKYLYIFKEAKPSKDDILNLQKYVILACFTMIPPRRAMDFCKMKVRNYDKAEDNYYDKGTFYFRLYKTAKFTGLQIEKVPKGLEMLLRRWIAFHDQDYLFCDYYNKEITSSGMTKILNSIFKPKLISVNMLRHIHITEKQGPLIAELEKTAEAMGHSVAQQKLYVKKD